MLNKDTTMTDTEIKDLVEEVINSSDYEQHKQAVREVLTARITVKPSMREVVTDEGEVIGIERYADDADIIQAIRAAAPDTISERIYFFPQGRYLFITDKGYPYNVKQKDRPLTAEEREQIDSMRYALRVRKDYLFTDEDKQRYAEDKKDYGKQIRAIYKRAEDEGEFEVKQLKKSKQIRIYVSSYYKDRFRELGYKIIEQERETYYSRWDADLLRYEKVDSKEVSFSFVMNYNAFMSACKSGVIPQKGYYVNEQGERVVIEQSGQREAITVRDAEGLIRKFESKAEAARELGVSPSLLSKLIKATPEGEVITISKGAKNNRKGFTLITAEGDKLDFMSVRDAATRLGVDKSKVSRVIKGKVSGDTVTLLGVSYRLAL